MISKTLINVANINVKIELKRHVDRNSSRTTLYFEKEKFISKFLKTRNSNLANLSNKLNDSNIVFLLLTNFLMLFEIFVFVFQNRIVFF